MKKIIVICIFCIATLSSCVTVQPYEMMNINDPDMSLQDRKCDKHLLTFHSYREAAVGGNSGKTGGGCGCN